MNRGSGYSSAGTNAIPLPQPRERTQLWDELGKLVERLYQKQTNEAKILDEGRAELWRGIFDREQRLKEVIAWNRLGKGLDRLRHNAGIQSWHDYSWLVFVIVWALIWVATNFLVGFALACAFIFFAKRSAHADLLKALRVRFIHYLGRSSNTNCPMEFVYLTGSDTETKVVDKIWNLPEVEVGLGDVGLVLEDGAGKCVGYMATGDTTVKLYTWDGVPDEFPRTVLKSEFAQLLDSERTAIRKYDEIETHGSRIVAGRPNLERAREMWADIVLPEDVEEHLLRAMLLFAYGDASAPRGILLKGPPGTGKSLVAQTMADSFGVSLIKLSVAGLKGEHVGQSGNNVRRLWEKAREQVPVVIFLDECEGIFTRRGSDEGDSFVAEAVQTFLTEWDGIGERSRILVIGATNRADLLDDAIVSRFTDVVELLPVGTKERDALVAAVARQIGLAQVIPENVVQNMAGLSGRDVRNVLQQAMRRAAPEAPSLSHFETAITKVRGKVTTKTEESATWDSLVLPDPIKDRLKTLCSMLKEVDALTVKGIPVPRTLLLYGPPGTGKTQIARTIANEANIAFRAYTTADLKGQYLGHAANRVAQAFESARSASPCILFLDELDALTSSRGGDLDQLQTEALSQLLQELDGVAAKPGFVFVMGATNRVDAIDNAILSRFNRQIEIGLPGTGERVQLLQNQLKGRPVSADMDVEQIARRCRGFSGRDLRELVSEAFNIAVQRIIAAGGSAADTELRQKDLEQAMPPKVGTQRSEK